MEEMFKKAGIVEGISVDGEHLTYLRFVDDVAIFNGKTEQMAKHLNSQHSEKLYSMKNTQKKWK